jgi:hypothetical protein
MPMINIAPTKYHAIHFTQDAFAIFASFPGNITASSPKTSGSAISHYEE